LGTDPSGRHDTGRAGWRGRPVARRSELGGRALA